MNNILSNENLLNDIFKRLLNISFIDEESLKDKHFFSPEVNMLPSELVYIFFEIEKIFGICISENEIVNEKFTTFNHVLNIINSSRKSLVKTIVKS